MLRARLSATYACPSANMFCDKGRHGVAGCHSLAGCRTGVFEQVELHDPEQLQGHRVTRTTS